MRILLLGGSGFIGSAVKPELESQDHEVITLSTNASADVRLDLRAPGSIEDYLATEHFNTVINLAGAGLTSGTADLATMTSINSELPLRLYRALAAGSGDSGTQLIHASSSTERLPGHKTDESDYSRTKFAGTSSLEAVLQETRALSGSDGVHVTVCRIHNTYGPGQPEGRFMAHVINRLEAGQPVTLKYPHRIRDFVFIDDITHGLSQLVELGNEAPTHAELGTGAGIRLRDSAYQIADLLGRPRELIQQLSTSLDDPNPITIAADRYGSLDNCQTDFLAGLTITLKGH